MYTIQIHSAYVGLEELGLQNEWMLQKFRNKRTTREVLYKAPTYNMPTFVNKKEIFALIIASTCYTDVN